MTDCPFKSDTRVINKQLYIQYFHVFHISALYGGILLPTTCKITYVNMRLTYVNMRLVYVSMQYITMLTCNII